MAEISQQDLLGAIGAAISLCSHVDIQPTAKRLQLVLASVEVHVPLERIKANVEILRELSHQEESEGN
jgi:hypothetical protein